MELTPDGRSAYKLYEAVRKQTPLIQCITNFVSMVGTPVHANVLGTPVQDADFLQGTPPIKDMFRCRISWQTLCWPLEPVLQW